MKRLFLFWFIVLLSVYPVLAGRTGKMKICGVDCEYDTLMHRHVGPGVTYTEFQFNKMNLGGSIPNKMRAHLLTIDMANPYNQVSPYIAGDVYYESNRQDQEVQRQKKIGFKPVASVNGFGFVQTRPSVSEPYTYMESINHLVSNGLIRYENDSKAVRYYNDAAGKGHIGPLTMKAKVTSSKGASAEIGQINHHRDHARRNNKLALFCNDMDMSKDTQLSLGVEVVLRGGYVRVGTNRLEVVKKKSGCGISIYSGQSVLTGAGAEMEAFLNGLEEGETVSIEIGYVDGDGKEVVPSDTYSAFIANCVKEGVAAGWEKENYAISATGVSKDGSTLYLADLEISPYSNAPARCVEDLLIAVGAWNACYNDGGPSADMTIDGKFVSNNSIAGTDFHRYIANGVMVYSTAPNDYILESVECADITTVELNIGDTFTPKLYGYNQYGEMITDNAGKRQAVEISCPQELGEIGQEGTFTATKSGKGEITVRVNGIVQVSIPVVVAETKSLILSPGSIFTGEGRAVQLNVKYVVGKEATEVDPSEVLWSVDDENVVSDCTNGLVVPYMDGFATVTASYKDVTGTVSVEVENLEAEGMESVELTGEVGSLTDMNLQLPSVPRSMYLEIQTPAATRATDAQPVTVRYTAGAHECEKVLECKDGETVIRESILFDYEAPDGYPVVLNSISPATAEVLCIKAVYTENYSAIENLYADESDRFIFSRTGKQLTLVNCAAATDLAAMVYALDGTKLAEIQTYLPEAGSCTLDVMRKDPVIVRIQTKNGVQVFKLMAAE